ncbi:MAG: hypothetical protein HDS97_07215 [Bacteroidales bacterium]|nr:hypothetical protein [Bacteroidales bacterium]
MEKTNDKPILTALRKMEIGESLPYPVERTSYLRSACVSFGLEWGKKFKTKTNREEWTVSAIQTA